MKNELDDDFTQCKPEVRKGLPKWVRISHILYTYTADTDPLDTDTPKGAISVKTK